MIIVHLAPLEASVRPEPRPPSYVPYDEGFAAQPLDFNLLDAPSLLCSFYY